MRRYLHCDGTPALNSTDIVCVALAHNEGPILPHFLSHYRNLGVNHFLIVDDRSTDNTAEILAGADDVTVFSPSKDSTYKEHKRFWRAELLDQFCAGKWCIVPDLDEHLVYNRMDDLRLPEIISNLEKEGAEAVQATMVDMYCDTPFNEILYEGGPLIEAFPLFDGPDHHFRLMSPRRFRKKYPTPDHIVIGGVRQRMFMPLHILGTSWRERFFRRVSSLGRMSGAKESNKAALLIARALIKPRLKRQKLFNQTKVPLVRWRKGLFYYNGAHALSENVKISKAKMALLHYCFASGPSGFEQKAARGEHTNGSEFYQKMLDGEQARQNSPVFEGTKKYVSESSLGSFLG